MNNTLIYIGRLLWFILRYTVVILFVVALMVIGFHVVKDTTNVYIIVSEGMEERASVILNLSEPNELFKYFEGNYLAGDEELGTSLYDEFFIRGFKYDLEVKSIWCNPWDLTADVEIVESIPVINGEYPAQDDEEPKELPAWPRRRYAIRLVNRDGAWLIEQVNTVEDLPPMATPTDEPEITPTPEGMTPSPAPSFGS